MATAAPPGRSSSSVKLRPSAGTTPSVGRNDAVTFGERDALGVLAAGKVRGLVLIAGDGLERARRLVVVLDVGRVRLLDLRHAEPGRGVPELNEPLGLAVGQWPEQDGVHDAERGGRAGDPEPEGEDRDRREAGRPGETTEGWADLGDERHQYPV